MFKKQKTPQSLDTCQVDLHQSLEQFNSTWPRPTLSLLHLPPEIRHLIYDLTYSTRRAISYTHDLTERPETWIEAGDDPAAEEGELQPLVSPYHQITGLHHTCRLLRSETLNFNPLFKNIQGGPASLVRLLERPHPWAHLRAITICLQPGDTEFVQGAFTVSGELCWLLHQLLGMEQLARVKVEGCVSFFDAEEHAAFLAIWALLWERIVGEGDLEVQFSPSKVWGDCECCGMTVCRCLSAVPWANYVTIIKRQV